jgi:hypothetical protein
MHWLGITSAPALAALVIVAGACTAPLTYALARALLDQRRARFAALLVAFSPATLLFGVTSADWLYAAAGTGVAALLVRPRLRALGCAAFALSALLSWALLAIGAWAAFVVARREGARRAAWLAAGCGLAVLALNGWLALAFGYDPIGALRGTHDVYRHSVASRRPYAFWVLGSPVAFFVTLGLPTAWLALRTRATLTHALVLIVVASSVLGFTKAEVERIWLFVVPLAALAAAQSPARRPRLIVAALLTQAIVTEGLFGTVW